MSMCIGSENWTALPTHLRVRIVWLVRHTEEGMTTEQDRDTLLDMLSLWLDFCDPEDVVELIERQPEYDMVEPEDIDRACQD